MVFLCFAHDPNWADFWRSAGTPYGTMTAGYAAVAAATIAYSNGQQQRHQDQSAAEQQHAQAQSQLDATTTAADREHNATIVRDLRARFTTATQQLADAATTIQQAGAYALASLADDWLERSNTQEAQVCVDVLCTYLRTHHHTAAQQHNKPHGENYDYTQPPPDEPVRDTIIRIIHSHTQITIEEKPHPGPWSTLNYDLTGAHLCNLDLNGSHFAGAIRFDTATFSGDASFTKVTFSDAWFDAATFSGTARFKGATFSGHVFFDDATFSSDAWFSDVTFSRAAGFMGTMFSGAAGFDAATFSSIAGFGHAMFSGDARFMGATFSHDAWFMGATFTRDASFADVVIGPTATISVDWNDDPGQQPENVTPRPWPPQTDSGRNEEPQNM